MFIKVTRATQMKLNELIEAIHKEIPNVSISRKPLPDIQPSKWSEIGSGEQAYVYQHKQQPLKNEAIKVLDIYGTTADAAYQFVRLCKNHQNNPHFPKIHSMKMYPATTKHSGYMMSPPGHQMIIRMEKLKTIPNNKEFFLKLFGLSKDDIERFELDHYLDMFEMFDTPEGRREIYNRTEYPSLKQALRLLEPLFRNFEPDMHGGNIMYRDTPTGPILVFIDPVN